MSRMLTAFPNHGVKLSKWTVIGILAAGATTGAACIYLKRSKGNVAAVERPTLENANAAEIEQELGNGRRTAEDEQLELDLKATCKADEWKQRGNIAYGEGQYEEAIVCYSKAIAVSPQQNQKQIAICYQNRAAAYEKLQCWAEVKADCTKSIAFVSNYAKAYYRRAKAHEVFAEMKECLEDISTACILDKFKTKTFVLYADIILQKMASAELARTLGKRTPILASRHFIRSQLKLLQDDAALKQVYNEVCFEDNLYGFARAKKAIQLQHFEVIIAACNEELESEHDATAQYRAEALLLRGLFHMFYGNFEASKQDFSNIAANAYFTKPMRVSALLRRSVLYLQLQRFDLALNDCYEAQKLMPEIADIYEQRGEIYLYMTKMEEALTAYNKVLQLKPNRIRAALYKWYVEYGLAMLAENRMRTIHAITEVHKITEKHANFIDCYVILTRMLMDQEQYKQADHFHLKAIQLEPDNPLHLVTRAILLLKWKGDTTVPFSLLEAAISMDEKFILAYETLATVQVKRGHMKHAIQLFQTAIENTTSPAELKRLFIMRNAAHAQNQVLSKMVVDKEFASHCYQMPAPISELLYVD